MRPAAQNEALPGERIESALRRGINALNDVSTAPYSALAGSAQPWRGAHAASCVLDLSGPMRVDRAART